MTREQYLADLARLNPGCNPETVHADFQDMETRPGGGGAGAVCWLLGTLGAVVLAVGLLA